MKQHSLLLICAGLLALSSCSGPSKYMPRDPGVFGNNYGYAEVRFDTTGYQVLFMGNDKTEPATVEKYTLYRAAELTAQRGYDYFDVLNGNGGPGNAPSSDMTVEITQVMPGKPGMSAEDMGRTPINPGMKPSQITPNSIVNPNPDDVPGARNTAQSSTTTLHLNSKLIRMHKGTRSASDTTAIDAKAMLRDVGPSIER